MIGRCAHERSQANSIAILESRTQVRRPKDEDANLNCAPPTLLRAGQRSPAKGVPSPTPRVLLRLDPPRPELRFAASRIKCLSVGGVNNAFFCSLTLNSWLVANPGKRQTKLPVKLLSVLFRSSFPWQCALAERLTALCSAKTSWSRTQQTCRRRITKLRRQSAFGISLDNAFAIDRS